MILRKVEGKEKAYYFDFMDCGNFHRIASKKRIKILKKFGHKVEVKKYE